MNIRKSIIGITLCVLVACSAQVKKPIDAAHFEFLLPGRWLCEVEGDRYTKDHFIEYHQDGALSSQLFMELETKNDQEVAAFDMSINGSWELKGAYIYQELQGIQLIPKNEYSASIKNIFSYLLPQEGFTGKTEILALDSHRLVIQNSKNSEMICVRQ